MSYDTTSTNVWGDYSLCKNEDPPPGPNITYGYSKDHRPDLKQFMTELLCVDRGVPIFGQVLDGNSSDKTSNNKMLTRISAIMAKHGLGTGAFVYVADSAMVTEANLATIGENRFISRLPASYKECKHAINEAVTANCWTDLGTLAESPSEDKKPVATYKIYETSVTLHEIPYRAVVVHSSAHDKRRKKRLEKAITASSKELRTALSGIETVYFCQADAVAAAKRARGCSSRLHQVKTTIDSFTVRKRGRPSATKPASTTTRYRLSWELELDTQAVEREKQIAGCFVLLCNVPVDGEGYMDGEKVLKTYKGQYGIESDFAFLKDPLIVNDVFLKKPHRIEVLGMILIIALTVWRLMERSMRVYLQNRNTTIEGWEKRRTKKPTAFMMTTVITGFMVAHTGMGRILLRKPTKRQDDFLTALGLKYQVFLDHRFKCQPVIPLYSDQKG